MSATLFYVPALHRQVAPAHMPPGTAFFPVSAQSNPALAAEKAACSALPLDAAQARAVLAEILRQGEELSQDGLLRTFAARKDAPEGDLTLRAEMNELRAFVDAGQSNANTAQGSDEQTAEQTLRSEQTRRALIDCQIVLLLAFFQEERALELQALRLKAEAAQAALAAALGEGGPALPGETLPDEPVSAPWRVIVDAALPFLPDGDLLFTLDDNMALDLEEAGLLQALPQDRNLLPPTWPDDLKGNLLYARLPGWRLAGRAHLPPERPWLAREVELLVMRPSGALDQGEKRAGTRGS